MISLKATSTIGLCALPLAYVCATTARVSSRRLTYASQRGDFEMNGSITRNNILNLSWMVDGMRQAQVEFIVDVP
jgi:predicted patatin/cPLA2 family phospholipase